MIHHGPHLGGIPIFSFIVYLFMAMGTTFNGKKNPKLPSGKPSTKFKIAKLKILLFHKFIIFAYVI
jgi:hypothetical protein